MSLREQSSEDKDELEAATKELLEKIQPIATKMYQQAAEEEAKKEDDSDSEEKKEDAPEAEVVEEDKKD